MPRPENVVRSVLAREESYPKTASVAGSRGDWIVLASGYAKRAVAADTALLGILPADWTNDATNDMVSVSVDEHGIYEMDASATLMRATHVGNTYDLTDHDTLNLATQSTNVLRVVGITPDGRALCKLNKPY